MRWNRDRRYQAGGYWRCDVKRNALRRERLATDLEFRQREFRRRNEWWHRADGGYTQRRLRDLQRQREGVLERLRQLEQEAVNLVEP